MKTSLLLLLTFLLTSSDTLIGQWVSSFDSYHGNVWELTESNSLMYAGTSKGGIFTSSDNGTSWNLITSGEIKNDVISIYANDSLVFAGTNGGGIFIYSKNNGWKRLDNLSDTVVNKIVLSASGNLIVGTENGIFVSSDNGANWYPQDSIFDEKSISGLVITDSSIYAGNIIGEIFVSSDQGKNWIKSGNINYEISSLTIFNDKILASTVNNGIFFSEDNGYNWEEANNGLFNHNIIELTSNDSRIYAATWMGEGGVFVSSDSGSNWEPIVNLSDSLLNSILAIDNNIFTASLNGIFYSTNNGEVWSEVILGGITNYNINCIDREDSILYAGTQGGGILKSTDLGKTWATINSGLTNLYIRSLISKDSIVLAGTYQPAIFRSTDYGTTWSIADSSLIHIGQDFVFKDRVVYVANGTDIFSSDNYGATWTALNLTGDDFGQSVNAVATLDSNVFAGTGTSGVFRTTNNGIDWVSCGSSNAVVNMATKDSLLFIGTNNGIFKSSDFGNNWTSSGFQSQYIFTIVPYENFLFAGTSQGIFFSQDNGEEWQNIGGGLNEYVTAIIILDSTIYAGTNGEGVWAGPLAQVVTEVEGINIQVKSNFFLEQNYPNPFNPTTKIKFILPTESIVRLEVYNSIGEKVSEILNSIEPAGFHEVIFNADNFSSGFYIYSINIKSLDGKMNYKESKKMLLIK